MYLAIDTSTPWMTMALGDQESILFHLTVSAGHQHSRQLIAGLAQLKNLGWLDRDKLRGILAGRGPGSFTGVKIAVMTAQSLAYALDQELHGYSTLEGMARLVPPGYGTGKECRKLVPVIVHKRNEIFWSEFDFDFTPKEETAPQVGSVEEFLSAFHGKQVLVICPWIDQAQLFQNEGLEIYPPDRSIPDARTLIALHSLAGDGSSDQETTRVMGPVYGSSIFTE